MELPIRFPSEADVIRADAARFRALTPQQRVQKLRGMLLTGARLKRLSLKADFMSQYIQEQETLARLAVREFLSRHAV